MIKTLAGYVKEYKKASILTPIFMILEVVAETLIPLLMASIINEGIEAGNLQHVYTTGIWMVLVAVFGLITGMLGGKFGAEYDPSAETYTYGTTPENIAYCGPYVVSSIAAKSTIVFSANPSYWNKDGINIHTITWLYNDGTDTTKGYTDMKAGTIDGAGLNASTVELAKTDGVFDTHVYTSSTNATSFMAFFNL